MKSEIIWDSGLKFGFHKICSSIMSSSESEQTLIINEILVIITFGVMIVSITACVFMYVFRDNRRKEAPEPQLPAGSIKRNRMVDKANKEKSGMIGEPVSTKSEPKLVGIMKKDSSLRKDSTRRIRIDTSNLDEYPARHPVGFDEMESAPLMYETSEVSEFTDDSSLRPNRELNEAFMVVLSDGITLTLHTTKTSRSSKLSFADGHLICRIKKMLSIKVVQVELADIQSVQVGKATPNFQRSGLQRVAEENCFSLIVDNRTFDFEATSKYERDAIASGLSKLVQREKARVGLLSEV